MANTPERRDSEHAPAEEFSPEYLAMLVLCGGSVRDSDWSVLPASLANRRPAANSPRTAEDGAAHRGRR